MIALSALALAARSALGAPVLAPQVAASSLAPDTPRVVTLITGDRVVVRGAGQQSAQVLPAPGRESLRFITRRLMSRSGQVQHLYVFPEDAIPLLRADQVDRRLFDVSLLLDFAYDDANRLDLPLIITYRQRAPQARAAAPRAVVGAVPKGDLPVINGSAVSSDKSQLQAFWSGLAQPAVSATAGSVAPLTLTPAAGDEIRKVWLDALRRPQLDRSVPQIGAPAAWAAGFEGDGVVVAVLDTGVDASHPDLVDSIIVSKNFTQDPDGDQVGHGTHVASIIAGSGAAEGGRYRGVAPGAQLLAGKVCEDLGCPDSSLIAGMQWAVKEQGARVVNLSIGGTDDPGIDPVEEAVNTLSAQHQTLFVIAAGNSGPDLFTIESPGSSESALTVAAVDRDDSVASFSSRGLRVGDSGFKPDLGAPGVGIVAARAAGTELGTAVGDEYVALSGTSMATPHAAGAAALLFQQHPDWSAAQVKAVLMGSAAFHPGATALEQGAGRVDIAQALTASLVADTPSVSFGTPLWPHQDDPPIQRTVNLRNLGAATELVLQLDVSGPDGARAPEGMFTVSPTTLELPAGGTGFITVTANTSLDAPDGVYGGRLIASDGVNRSVAIPLAVYREIESYDLSLRHLDRTGQPATNYVTTIFGLDQPTFAFVSGDQAGDRTVRLPAGQYAVEAEFLTENEPYTLIAAPGLQLDSQRLLVFDQRDTAPVNVTAPSRNAERFAMVLEHQIITENSGFSSFASLGDTSPLYYAATLKPIPPTFQSTLHAQWLDSSTQPSSFYTAAWFSRDGLVKGPAKSIPVRKTAVVHASYAASLGTTDLINDLSIAAIPPGAAGWPLATVTGPLPLQRTEYYYSDDRDVRWLNELWMHDEEYLNSIIIGWVAREYRAGRSYTSRWNRPLFSMLLPEETLLLPSAASRAGDTITLFPSLYADGDRHAGYVVNESHIVLFRDGEKLAESEADAARFDVPPEPGKYRVELDYAQNLFQLTSKQRIVWEFESEHVAEGEERLPLLAISFDPALDERGRVARGSQFCLPLSVSQFGRKDVPSVRDISLEVSFDDGATWARAQVERNTEGWQASFDHPRRGDYVSLRASTRDRQGNSVEQTVIRAYGLAAPR